MVIAPLMTEMQPPVKRHVATPANDTPQSAVQPKPAPHQFDQSYGMDYGHSYILDDQARTPGPYTVATANDQEIADLTQGVGQQHLMEDAVIADNPDNPWGWANWNWSKDAIFPSVPATSATYESVTRTSLDI